MSWLVCFVSLLEPDPFMSMLQGETQALVASILERQAALEEEVKALRKENQQLKHFF